MILELKKISKSFGGVKAINETSFSVSEGEIFASLVQMVRVRRRFLILLQEIISQQAERFYLKGKELIRLSLIKLCIVV